MSSFDFPYSIVRSQRKTAAIHVSPRGVQVRIPHGVTDEFALRFLDDKQRWVRKKLIEQALQQALIPEAAIGKTLLWQGEEKTLIYQKGLRWRIFLQSDLWVIEGPSEPEKEKIISLLESFYKQQARQVLTALTQHVAGKLNLLNRLNKVTMRRTKSKWGHCTSAGVIQYNWLIMGAPEAVIYYLVCHEVCHLKHANHGKQFWNLVEGICPNYIAAQKWLKENGLRLDWMNG
jgi:predicted metal-dependent hydrolase